MNHVWNKGWNFGVKGIKLHFKENEEEVKKIKTRNIVTLLNQFDSNEICVNKHHENGFFLTTRNCSNGKERSVFIENGGRPTREETKTGIFICRVVHSEAAQIFTVDYENQLKTPTISCIFVAEKKSSYSRLWALERLTASKLENLLVWNIPYKYISSDVICFRFQQHFSSDSLL